MSKPSLQRSSNSRRQCAAARSFRRRLLATEWLESRCVLAAPVAGLDSFDYVETGELHVASPGVLANDTDADGDPLTAVLASPPANGSLSLAADGSFVYTPNPGFSGADAFTYRAAANPLLRFNVVSAESTITVDATLHTPLGSRSASDSGRIAGYADARLTPPSGGATQIHIVGLHGELIDTVELVFNYGLLGRLTATIQANQLQIDMVQPGAAAAVTAGAFNQTANTLLAVGTANLASTGVIGGIAPIPPTVDINSTFVTDLPGTLSEAGGVLRLTAPIDVSALGEPVADGVTVDYHIYGTLVATIAVPPAEQSTPTTVTLAQRIDATNDYYRAPLDGTLSPPANPPFTESTLFPTGSAWKYLDNGSDQGALWRARSFDDSSWASGNAQLGYGEGDEVTVVSYGSDAANKPITTYFRKSFDLGFSGDVFQLALQLKRDDGAVIYINGTEVLRDNLPAGAVTFTTRAAIAADDGQTFRDILVPISSEVLVDGVNVIAVEIHQTLPDSTDISFDLGVSARRAARGLLANDADRLAGPDTPYLVAEPKHGALSLNPDGTFAYTAAAGYQGADAFSYVAAPLGANMFVPPRATWRYLDDGSDQGTAWRDLFFNDAAWSSGAGQFGYGDGDENTLLSFGPDANNKYITTYFRQSFTVIDAAAVGPLTLNVVRDDGILVYLNGVPIAASNLPAGASSGTLATQTVSAAGESQPLQFTIPAGVLTSGTNVLAVELHQAAVNSTDLSFQAWLSDAATARPANVQIDVGPFFDLNVTNTNDSGAGSLRQAILNANSAAGPSTIVFAIPGAGPHVILPLSPLPDLVEQATMEVPVGMRIEIGGASGPGLSDFVDLAKTGQGMLLLGGGDSHLRGRSLSIQAGMVKLAENGGRLLELDQLSIAPVATLNLFDNDLVVHATAFSRVAVFNAVAGYVASGAAGLTWDGNGIASSAAEEDPGSLTALGVMLNDNGLGGPYHPLFDGIPAGPDDVLVKYTYYGDADLSGVIDGTDYALIDNGYNSGATTWFGGDFEYSHAVDGTDYALIDNAYNQQTGPLAGGIPAALAPAPAPALHPAPAAIAEGNTGPLDAALERGEFDLVLPDWSAELFPPPGARRARR